MAVNGASEKGTEGSRAIHKLMQEASELKESLRLERSRNADMDREFALIVLATTCARECVGSIVSG